MDMRPELNLQLNGQTFRSYYYLKEELAAFCREYGLPACGSKTDISDRIEHYLDTGEILSAAPVRKIRSAIDILTDDTLIEPNIVCSEKHRAYFKEKLGSNFRFNVTFQKWLKSNAGKSYAQAVEIYSLISEEKQKGKTVIDSQFEYNTYIRNFFEDNEGKSLKEAIKCWKYKKGIKGHNRYEKSDLDILNE